MEAFYSSTQMTQMKGVGVEASSLPAFRVGGLGTLVSGTQGEDAGTISYGIDRRMLAGMLLETLEDQQYDEEPDYGWMDTPMDLELFEQSLTPTTDDALTITHNSSWVSNPLTPIYPSSPQTAFDYQVDVTAIKPDPADTADSSERLLETLEQMMKQIQDDDASSSTATIEKLDLLEDDGAEDVTSALLDRLIQGNIEEDVALAEITEIALKWMENPVLESTLFIDTQPSPEPPVPSVSSFSDSVSISSPSTESEEAPEPKMSEPKRSSVTQSTARGRKARMKPEERKDRKKEQNKSAATRYREKKKLELELAHEEELILDKKNRKLRKEHSALLRELRFMKQLMRDVFNPSAKTS